MRNEIGLTKGTQAILSNPPAPFEYYDHEDYTMTCQALLNKYMPDFCWMTFQGLFRMLEQINPDIDENTCSVTLSRLHKRGRVMSKKDEHPTNTQRRGIRGLLYMRVP